MASRNDYSYDNLNTSSRDAPVDNTNDTPSYASFRQLSPPPAYQDLENVADVPPPSYSPAKSYPNYPPPSYQRVPGYHSINSSTLSPRLRPTRHLTADDVSDNMRLAIFSLILCWPLGVLAVLKASEARASVASGDYDQALQHSIGSFRLAAVAICSSLIIICFLIIPIVIFIGVSDSDSQD